MARRLVIRLNAVSKIGATMIIVGVALSLYARAGGDNETWNRWGIITFVSGFIVYFVGRARDFRKRTRLSDKD